LERLNILKSRLEQTMRAARARERMSDLDDHLLAAA